MTTHRIIMLAVMVLAGAFRAMAQCTTPLVFDPANTVHTDISSVLTLNIKTDFCATGAGVTNDQAAFEAASAFIKKRSGYAKLVIPAGTYRVGRQTPGSSSPTDFLSKRPDRSRRAFLLGTAICAHEFCCQMPCKSISFLLSPR